MTDCWLEMSSHLAAANTIKVFRGLNTALKQMSSWYPNFMLHCMLHRQPPPPPNTVTVETLPWCCPQNVNIEIPSESSKTSSSTRSPPSKVNFPTRYLCIPKGRAGTSYVQNWANFCFPFLKMLCLSLPPVPSIKSSQESWPWGVLTVLTLPYCTSGRQ
jgi:hypothetical protein